MKTTDTTDPQANNALWATRQTATFLGCSERQIARLREEGLPFVRVGGLVRFIPSKVMAWLDAVPEDERARQLADIAATGDDGNAECAAADLSREFPPLP
jgi:excisionase family DNA binding protein